MIAKLDRTQNNAYQNKDKHRSPANNVKDIKQLINNNRTTTLEQTAAYLQTEVLIAAASNIYFKLILTSTCNAGETLLYGSF